MGSGLSLLTGKAGRALFTQGGNAFQVIGTAHAERFIGNACVHHRVGNPLQLQIGQDLGGANRAGRTIEQALAESIEEKSQTGI